MPPGDGEAVHQGVDTLDGVMLGLVGQMGIAGGGENGVMAEELLHLDQIDTGLCRPMTKTIRLDEDNESNRVLLESKRG